MVDLQARMRADLNSDFRDIYETISHKFFVYI